MNPGRLRVAGLVDLDNFSSIIFMKRALEVRLNSVENAKRIFGGLLY